MSKRRPKPTKNWIWLKAGLLGVAIATLIAFVVWNQRQPPSLKPSPSFPAQSQENTIENIDRKEFAKVQAAPSKVKDAITAKDWTGLKVLLQDSKSAEENISQVLRAQDLHLVDPQEGQFAEVLIGEWPTTPTAKPRVRVLLVNAYSKMNLSASAQSQLRQKMSKLKQEEARRLLAECFVSTNPYPSDSIGFLKKAILAPEPSAAREALYVAERVNDPVAKKKLTGDLSGQFFKVAPGLRPYVASLIMRDLSAFKKDPRSKAIVDYIRMQKEDVWRDIQASVR